LFSKSRKKGRQSLIWSKVWPLKKLSREQMMIEALQQLIRELEGKMTVIFQQLVKESEDLKNEVKELQSTREMLRTEKSRLTAKNLILKYGILQASETIRDLLWNIVMEANESAPEQASRVNSVIEY
jgi:archaellum component FlaC